MQTTITTNKQMKTLSVDKTDGSLSAVKLLARKNSNSEQKKGAQCPVRETLPSVYRSADQCLGHLLTPQAAFLTRYLSKQRVSSQPGQKCHFLTVSLRFG